VEEASYDSQAMCRFTGIDLGEAPVPVEGTISRFRHLQETHNLGERLLEPIVEYLQDRGLRISTGTIMDAPIISVPSSTKNRQKQRDPDMHQTKKGKQWYFGMKAHIGVDSKSKLMHAVVATAANVHHSHALPDLLHVEEKRIWGDSTYSVQGESIQAYAPQAQDFTNKKGCRSRPLNDADKAANRTDSGLWENVQHPIYVLKQVFGFVNVRYRGLPKNASRLACGLVNPYMARRH
jgi:IS5 family transposase